MEYYHSVHTPLPGGGGGGWVEPPTKFSERVGLTGPKLLEGVTFSREGCNFHKKYQNLNNGKKYIYYILLYIIYYI